MNQILTYPFLTRKYYLIPLYLLLFLFSLSSIFGVIIPDDTNTRGYYNFSNAGEDATGLTGTLTATGTPNQVTGIIGDAFNFDGAENFDAVTLPVTALPFSFNAWVNSSGDVADGGVVAIGDASAQNVYFMLGVDGGLPTVFARNGGGQFEAQATTDIGTGQWFMITGVFNSATDRRIYVNGVNEANSSDSISFNGAIDLTSIGQNADNQADQFFEGVIDEVSMWNKTLTQIDIDFLYNSGLACGWNYSNCPSATIPIVTNLSAAYATEDFGVSVNATQNINMSFSIDGAAFTSICNVCNESNVNITGQTIGNHNVTWRSINSAGTEDNNQTFEIQPFQFFRFNDTSGSGLITNYTFNGTASNGTLVTLDARNFSFGNNVLTFSKLGFIDTNFTILFNNTMQINDTFQISVATIQVSIFNRETLNLLTGLTTITLEATVGFNGTTTTGLINISSINFTSEQYQILAEHAGFGSENVFFQYNNQEILAVDIFMLNSSSPDAGTITLIVKNSLSQLVESAICSVLEWRPAESAFVTVAQGLTNVNGETIVNIELNTKIYRFSCTKQTFTTITNAQIIQLDDSELSIILNDILLVPTTLFPNLATALTNSSLNATHQLITYAFTDSDGLTTEGCLQAFQINGNRETFIQESCVSTSTGTILLTVDINQTFTTEMRGVLTTPLVTDYVTDTLIFKGTGDIAFQLARLGLDILIPTIFILLGLGLGVLLSDVNISMVLMAVGGWFAVALVPTVISGTLAMFVTVIAALTIYGGFVRK